jgi:hypothetical protein
LQYMKRRKQGKYAVEGGVEGGGKGVGGSKSGVLEVGEAHVGVVKSSEGLRVEGGGRMGGSRNGLYDTESTLKVMTID